MAQWLIFQEKAHFALERHVDSNRMTRTRRRAKETGKQDEIAIIAASYPSGQSTLPRGRKHPAPGAKASYPSGESIGSLELKHPTPRAKASGPVGQSHLWDSRVPAVVHACTTSGTRNRTIETCTFWPFSKHGVSKRRALAVFAELQKLRTDFFQKT